MKFNKDNRLLCLYIILILNKFARNDYKLYQKEIIYYLEDIYGYKVSRRALNNYIVQLRNEGFIEGKRGVYSKVRLIKE